MSAFTQASIHIEQSRSVGRWIFLDPRTVITKKQEHG